MPHRRPTSDAEWRQQQLEWENCYREHEGDTDSQAATQKYCDAQWPFIAARAKKRRRYPPNVTAGSETLSAIW